MMKKLLFLAFLVLVAACSPGGSPIDAEDDDTNVDVVDPGPVFPYHPDVNWEECGGQENNHPCNIISFDHDNIEFDLYKHYGSLIVVDLSAMWCGPCNSAGAHAQEVQDLYAAEDLIYVTVLVENSHGVPPTADDIHDWATTYGNTTSPVIPGDRGMLVSSGGSWDLTGWPTFFYMDREMVIRDVDRGYNGEEVLYSIEWLLTL